MSEESSQILAEPLGLTPLAFADCARRAGAAHLSGAIVRSPMWVQARGAAPRAFSASGSRLLVEPA